MSKSGGSKATLPGYSPAWRKQFGKGNSMMSKLHRTVAVLASILLVDTSLAAARDRTDPPKATEKKIADREAEADAWAASVEARMTDEERFSLIHGFMALPMGSDAAAARAAWPKDVIPAAGYVPGIPRLNVPSLRETDASLGVTNPFGVRPGDTATALPAGMALGATFDPDLAYKAGALVGSEARAKGFNVLLGGGMNLMRDPRNGRNFEYLSEDPLLAGLMAGAEIKGAQDAGVVSTAKHFATNSNETNRHTWNAEIEESAHRESDLLAFQIAIERGRPGSIMCAYNLVNGSKACGNDFLLNTVLKKDWGYKGWVMSDWGAVSSADFAMKGLDQQSGDQLDAQIWFDAPLKARLADGSFPRARLSDMVRRILRSMKLSGLIDQGPAPLVDMEAHAATALDVARKGIVLLKNDGVLPLAGMVKSIAVIGGKAQVGVLSGGGSSQVMPPRGWVASDPLGGASEMGAWRTVRWFAGAPVDALREQRRDATVSYDPGLYPQSAAALAGRSDVAIVFVSKYEAEGFDSPDLSLPSGQDALIEAVAAANPNTIVVLETGNPVTMPWLDKVKAVVAAWYPGQEGATAIADILTGKINPSGRLPITFPRSETQLPRPTIPSFGTPDRTAVTVKLNEGADVGYRWYARRGLTPRYAFGFGLSYTNFSYADFRVRGGRTITASVIVRNSGGREGADVPQFYLQSVDGVAKPRLIAFQRVTLKPGESRKVDVVIDPRLLADYDTTARQWRIAPGKYQVALARSANEMVDTRQVSVQSQLFGK